MGLVAKVMFTFGGVRRGVLLEPFSNLCRYPGIQLHTSPPRLDSSQGCQFVLEGEILILFLARGKDGPK